MRAFLCLALSPILFVNCVGGDDSSTVDAGKDVSAQDNTAPDSPGTDSAPDVATEAEAGVPLTGAFANVLVLPDTTLAWSAIDFASNGDVVLGGDLHDLSGTVTINGYGYTSVGGNDVLVIKLAANNGYKWAKSFGGTGDDRNYATVMDKNGDAYFAGDVYCTTATSVVAFGTANITCKHSGYNTLVGKLKSADGSVVWVETFDGATGYGTSCNTLAVNPVTGNVTVSCDVRGDMTFVDTSNVSHTVVHGNGTLSDVFLADLDPATGHVGKSAYLVGTGATDAAARLVYEPGGALYVTGTFTSSILNAYIPSTNNSSTAFTMSRVGSTQDSYVLKLDTSWAHLWDHVYSAGTKVSNASGAARDAAGDLYIAVTFSGTIDFGLGGMTSAGNQDIAVVKLSATGTVLAQTQLGTNGVISSYAHLAVDAAGNVAVAGMYQAQGAGLKIGATQMATSNNNAWQGFSAKLSGDLKTVIWAQGTSAPSANANSTGVRIDDVAIDPVSQQVGLIGNLVNATTDFGDGKQVTRNVQGLFFLRRAP